MEKQLSANEARVSLEPIWPMKYINFWPRAKSGEKIRLGDITILVRSNTDAVNIWKYFRQRGLPCVVFTDVSLFPIFRS